VSAFIDLIMELFDRISERIKENREQRAKDRLRKEQQRAIEIAALEKARRTPLRIAGEPESEPDVKPLDQNPYEEEPQDETQSPD